MTHTTQPTPDTPQDLIDIRDLIDYWRVRRDEAEKMVKSLIREERVILERGLNK